ncbi:hypothetical protein VULLAG_LOCUS24 [Vulpes lagopus]
MKIEEKRRTEVITCSSAWRPEDEKMLTPTSPIPSSLWRRFCGWRPAAGKSRSQAWDMGTVITEEAQGRKGAKRTK